MARIHAVLCSTSGHALYACLRHLQALVHRPRCLQKQHRVHALGWHLAPAARQRRRRAPGAAAARQPERAPTRPAGPPWPPGVRPPATQGCHMVRAPQCRAAASTLAVHASSRPSIVCSSESTWEQQRTLGRAPMHSAGQPVTEVAHPPGEQANIRTSARDNYAGRIPRLEELQESTHALCLLPLPALCAS